jgi:hypothetical protein
MAAEALYGFIGVLLGSATTALLTVYRERLVSTREREAFCPSFTKDLTVPA